MCIFKEQLRPQISFHFLLWANEEDKAGFLHLRQYRYLGLNNSLVLGDCPVHCRKFNSISVLYHLLDAIRPLTSSYENEKSLQSFPTVP